MAEAAATLPPDTGLQPVEYKGFVLGLERPSTCWLELIALGAREWEEVGDNEKLGEFAPDFQTSFKHELAGCMGVVTLRRLGSWELVGYFVGVLGSPLKTKGKKVLNEVGVYIVEEARTPWLARKLLDYVEDAARVFGADALIVSHRPEHSRVGKLYQRAGFTPLSVDYIKTLE